MSKSTAVFYRQTTDYIAMNLRKTDTYLLAHSRIIGFSSVFSMAAVSLLAFLVLCHLVHPQSAEDVNCPKSFQCGKLGNLSFPFNNDSPAIHHCGFFTVSDCHVPVQTIQFKPGGRFYEVENISQAGRITINDSKLQENLDSKSCEYFEHLDFLLDSPSKFFHYHPNLTIFKCNQPSPTPSSHNLLHVKCSSSYEYSLYYTLQDNGSSSLGPPNCSVIQIPVHKTPPMDGDLFNFLSARFSLQVQIEDICVQCFNKGGICQAANNGSFDRTCMVAGKDKSSRLPLILGLCFGASIIGMCLMFYIIRRCYEQKSSSSDYILRKCSQRSPLMFWKTKTESFKNIEVFLEAFGSLSPKRFSYSDIKKITNSFKDKLGEGGFGGVYRGKLQDGRPVAVKVLRGSKGNGEDFINEVSSISRTSHVNVVTLLGFCFEGHKRALVYEFMPNGSLEKFIYEKSPLTSDRQLKWETLYKIAVGIARGLEYLHRGCNTRILHFDIKPHNILLDQEFCPKICDFGLAKICPQKESIVSMLGARGTPGYIAPEVFSRNFGGVSHKSDVYSYEMMVLEMVGGRRNIDCEDDRTSELYFPHWIYKRLELHQELGLQGITDDVEKEEARKMIIVSMWCIQTNPSSRPPMSRVVEMLEARIDSLQIPPQPFLSSPSRSPGSDSPVIVSSYSSVS